MFWIRVCRIHKFLASRIRIPIRIANEGPVRILYYVWFPFMYSQKWNCTFQNSIITFCLPVPTLIYVSVRDLRIYFQDRFAYFAAGKYSMWTDPGNICMNHPQTRECGNWDWIHKGRHKWDFPWSALVRGTDQDPARIQFFPSSSKNRKKPPLFLQFCDFFITFYLCILV